MIASSGFSSEPDVEGFGRGRDIRVKVKASAAKGSDPPPFARERHVAEQRRFDRQHIEASHIAARVTALKHQHLQLVGGAVAGVRHAGILAPPWVHVQRNVGINRAAPIHKPD